MSTGSFNPFQPMDAPNEHLNNDEGMKPFEKFDLLEQSETTTATGANYDSLSEVIKTPAQAEEFMKMLKMATGPIYSGKQVLEILREFITQIPFSITQAPSKLPTAEEWWAENKSRFEK